LNRNGFKRSEYGFDTNKTNPFLSISIHFRLLGNSKNMEDMKNRFRQKLYDLKKDKQW